LRVAEALEGMVSAGRVKVRVLGPALRMAAVVTAVSLPLGWTVTGREMRSPVSGAVAVNCCSALAEVRAVKRKMGEAESREWTSVMREAGPSRRNQGAGVSELATVREWSR